MIEMRTETHGNYSFVVADLEVCVDCIMLLANGEGSGETVDAMTAKWGDDGRHLVPGGEDLGFGAGDCDGCGSGLAGDRFTAAMIRPGGVA